MTIHRAEQTSGQVTIQRSKPHGPPDRDRFAAGLRQAVKNHARPDRLRDNPLLDSALVTRVCGRDVDPALGIDALRTCITWRIAAFTAAPHTAIFARVLEATYLHPAATQAEAARDLGLSFSTYRRRLGDAIRLLTDVLWTDELLLRDPVRAREVDISRPKLCAPSDTSRGTIR